MVNLSGIESNWFFDIFISHLNLCLITPPKVSRITHKLDTMIQDFSYHPKPSGSARTELPASQEPAWFDCEKRSTSQTVQKSPEPDRNGTAQYGILQTRHFGPIHVQYGSDPVAKLGNLITVSQEPKQVPAWYSTSSDPARIRSCSKVGV